MTKTETSYSIVCLRNVCPRKPVFFGFFCRFPGRQVVPAGCGGCGRYPPSYPFFFRPCASDQRSGLPPAFGGVGVGSERQHHQVRGGVTETLKKSHSHSGSQNTDSGYAQTNVYALNTLKHTFFGNVCPFHTFVLLLPPP